MRRPALEAAVQLLLVCSVFTDDQIPIADDHHMEQREFVPQMLVEQRPAQLPFFIEGQKALSPRGRRPISPCGGRQPCALDGLTDALGSNLNTFPPGRPTQDNIGNICSKSRTRSSYGPHNLPQTGFSHLSRQGKAMNALEENFAPCCLKSDKSDQLQCAVEAWKKTLDDFCEEEFSVKTRAHHCCKKSGSERETCFSDDAANPDYITSAGLQLSSEDAGAKGRSLRGCPPKSPKCQDNSDSKYKLSELAFPPGEPKSSNIQNICKLRKYRPTYTENLLPNTGHGHYLRRAKAIQRMEGEFKKCCKTEDVACAHSGWQKVLGKFCAKEQIVKTKHHDCCKKWDQATMLSCFAREAPFPEYDREVEVLNLGNLTEDGLQKLCGESKLLTKQKQMPLLVSGMKESCCTLPEDRKLLCAAEQREKFIAALCGPEKNAWKDTQDCCSKEEPEREQCFSHYLQSVSLAVSQRAKGE
ncbi:extracellular matrix protein 1 [Eleutherodactylus coqui]|uniref:extracellular matrix protein 1 n=1 Tax=Eleutherodactylus coqui TaxID=57060 RepID=UPI0034635EA6